MRRYSAWGHDGSFRFKWQATLWNFFNKFNCDHKWKAYKFQALNNDYGYSDAQCEKCGVIIRKKDSELL